VYSQTLDHHAKHLKLVLDKLRTNQLYLKLEKSIFSLEEIMFIGYQVSKGGIKMDNGEEQAILEWPQPKDVHKLHFFLGLANYYRHFIKEYSKRIVSLTNLLMKEVKWESMKALRCSHSGVEEAAIAGKPVLHLSDFERSFKVQTYASS
ncbi:hypothetical protein AMTR_s00011p00258460, partial [Amborella trichopoda]